MVPGLLIYTPLEQRHFSEVHRTEWHTCLAKSWANILKTSYDHLTMLVDALTAES